MKVRSWLSTCSSASCIATSGDSSASPSPPLTLSPPPKSLFSDSSSSYSDSHTNSTNSSSIQSNLSLLTLPSLPSLQKLTLSPLNPSAALLTSLSPNRRGHVHFLALHNHLLYAASGDQIHVYETLTNTLLDTFSVAGTSGAVKSIAFRSCRILTAHQDCKIRVWKLTNRKKHKLVATLPTLEDRLRRSILPQNYVKIRRHNHRLWIQHHDAISGLAAAGGSYENMIFSISWDRSIKIWNSENLHCLQSINKAHDDAINAVAVSSDGLVYTGSADRKIKVWRREEKKFTAIATLEKHKSAVNALALSGDGSVLFSGSCDRSILVWEREDSAGHMAVAGALRGHAKAILCLINVRDLLMSGSADRTVRIWQRGFDGRFCCLAVLDGHRSPVRSIAAAECGGGVRVFSGCFDGEIRVWELGF
ncbi:protein JINGUBANG-like [Salvia divinorum]|uniref:Protein JINGUBANG-like n=1 Tax=Salvia divinorum TaxID=28513 RepID=A0ABD1G8D2_SALDI